MAKRPRIGQPPKYRNRGGTARHSFTMPKDLSEWLKEEAERRLALAVVQRELADAGHDLDAMPAAESLMSLALQAREGGPFRLRPHCQARL